jgi:hypothetical protein
VPTKSTSVRKSTVGSWLEARWKLWIAELSWTTIVYVPAGMIETFAPLASFSVIWKESFVPTIASRTGFSRGAATRRPAAETRSS